MLLGWQREEPLILWSGRVPKLGAEFRVVRWSDKHKTVQVRDAYDGAWVPAHSLQVEEILFYAIEHVVLRGLDV